MIVTLYLIRKENNRSYDVHSITSNETYSGFINNYKGCHNTRDMGIYLKNHGYWYEMGDQVDTLSLSIELNRCEEAYKDIEEETTGLIKRSLPRSLPIIKSTIQQFERGLKLKQILR